MTIAKGQPWGEPGELPVDAPVAGSDEELAHLAGQGHRIVGLRAGDLARTVGVEPGRPSTRMRLPVDLGVVTVDGVEHGFAAHVVVRNSWWRGRVVAVMNAQYVGAFDVAPRSHPNDGLLDVVDVDPTMTMADRWKARRRLPSGTHVPHPSISTRRLKQWSVEFERPCRVWIDGVRQDSRIRRIEVRCVPDALTIVV